MKGGQVVYIQRPTKTTILDAVPRSCCRPQTDIVSRRRRSGRPPEISLGFGVRTSGLDPSPSCDHLTCLSSPPSHLLQIKVVKLQTSQYVFGHSVPTVWVVPRARARARPRARNPDREDWAAGFFLRVVGRQGIHPAEHTTHSLEHEGGR